MTETPEPTPAAVVEVRDPCPHCGDHQLIPRRQMAEHVSRLHPDEPTVADAQAMLRRMAADAVRSPVRCPHCDAGPIPSTHWTKHLQRHHPDASTACTDSEGFCDAHGFHRHAPAPDGLRDRYAAAIRSCVEGGNVRYDHLADAALAVRDEELQRLRTETATADQLRADVQRERDRLAEQLAFADETARRLLERHQELAAERFAWQERGDRAEATIARMKRTNRMVNGGARDARERAEKAEATVERVRAECDRIEAAVRANPQDPDFDGAYLAALGHIRNALDEPSGGTGTDLPADTARHCGDTLPHPSHQFMRLDVVFNCPGNTPEPTS